MKTDNLRRGVSRRPLRMLLHRAATGDTEAYADLTDHYIDLITEYLSLCKIVDTDLLQKTETLLREGWQRLPYLKRLSDWERFLTTALMSVPIESAPAAAECPQELLDLEPQEKFALIAFDFENWSYSWLALALRVEPKELSQLLLGIRCKLLQIDLSTQRKKVRSNFALVSSNLDEQLTPAQQRVALQILCDCEETRTFKSRWLDLRCKLIEIRQQIRLQTDEREQFLKRVCSNLRHEKMLRPSLTSRLRNLISFEDLPAISGPDENRDLRYGD